MSPWRKGVSGNSRGRPRLGGAIAEKFRSNPKSAIVIDQIIEVATTLGTGDQHADAMACAKIVADRLLPQIKAQTISLESDGRPLGPVILPAVIDSFVKPD